MAEKKPTKDEILEQLRNSNLSNTEQNELLEKLWEGIDVKNDEDQE